MHPSRLEPDAILEALLEIRFDSADLPEITVGRLVDHAAWHAYARIRSPISDIPAAVRLSDPNLRFQPLLELRAADGRRIVKIGTNVISFHNMQTYLGWHTFSHELYDMIDLLFDRVSRVNVRRLGLRYINALTSSGHYISNIAMLNVNLTINERSITENFNVNYRVNAASAFTVLTRIATPEFVQGPALPSGTTAYVDVDVFTPGQAQFTRRDEVKEWLREAHDHEKDTFFRLLPNRAVDRLAQE